MRIFTKLSLSKSLIHTVSVNYKLFIKIRNQLDDIKRRELERLRHLSMRQYEVQNGIDKRHFKIPQHIEVQHATFEIEDLKKLIKTTSKDLVRTFFINQYFVKPSTSLLRTHCLFG